MKAPQILSTRQLKTKWVNELEAKGWAFIQHDFINKLVDIPTDIKTESIKKNIVLTSKSGVNAFLQVSKKLNLDLTNYSVYCISNSTRDAAIATGMHVQASASNASSLADEILKDKSVREVTHICSNRRRGELSEKLNTAKVVVNDIVAYRTEFNAIVIEKSYDAILFFSPSGIESFLSKNSLMPTPCFCIGQTTADYAKQKGYHHVYSADTPTEEALLTKLTNYFYKIPAHAKK